MSVRIDLIRHYSNEQQTTSYIIFLLMWLITYVIFAVRSVLQTERNQVKQMLKNDTRCLKETIYSEFELSHVTGNDVLKPNLVTWQSFYFSYLPVDCIWSLWRLLSGMPLLLHLFQQMPVHWRHVILRRNSGIAGLEPSSELW